MWEEWIALQTAPVETFFGRAQEVVAAFVAGTPHPRTGRRLPDALENWEEEIIEITLQCPQAIHPYLTEYFQRIVQQRRKLSLWSVPWRESGTQNLVFLHDRLMTGSPFEREMAVAALLQTRHPECIRLAVASETMQTRPPLHRSDYLSTCASATVENGEIRFLAHWETVYHLGFPADYPFDRRWSDVKHPTWDLTDDSTEFRHLFGGLVEGRECAYCGDPLHRTITIDPAPQGIGITGLPSLTLAACLSCSGWEVEPLYYRHNERGIPTSIRPEGTELIKPQFHSLPLIETPAAVIPTPRRWRWQEWDHRQNLQRVGGHPSWIQNAAYPPCPDCRRNTTFIMQLDSHLPKVTDSDHRDDIHFWGSGGLGYYFWCDTCRISAVLGQCT